MHTKSCRVIFFKIFIFSIIPGLQCSVNFLPYSKVTQSHIHVHTLFSHIIINCSFDWTPSLGTSVCHECGPNKPTNQKIMGLSPFLSLGGSQVQGPIWKGGQLCNLEALSFSLISPSILRTHSFDRAKPRLGTERETSFLPSPCVVVALHPPCLLSHCPWSLQKKQHSFPIRDPDGLEVLVHPSCPFLRWMEAHSMLML